MGSSWEIPNHFFTIVVLLVMYICRSCMLTSMAQLVKKRLKNLLA